VRAPEAVAPLGERAGTAEFGKLFSEAVGRVEEYRLKSEEATNRFLTGETEEIHQLVLAGQRAEVAFETFLQVRNKVVQAYQEVMRMQM
jgi:flagellar hook-basal body complex protein FliE